ncbi:MAG: hypothetical protein ABI386_12280 [Rhodanobacter sp.]
MFRGTDPTVERKGFRQRNAASADIAPDRHSPTFNHAIHPGKTRHMRAHHRCRSLIHVAAAVAAVAALVGARVHGTEAAPASAPNITEPRNAATGFAITLWMVQIDALGDHCAKLGGPSDAEFMHVLKAWQHRNAPYVNAALEYMADIEDFIAARRGEAAQKEFRAARKAEFVASTRKTEAVWFPEGMTDEASCRHMAAFVSNGSLDLDQNTEFFPILQTLKAESDRKRTP